jgi:hypothetical protein
MSSANDGGTIFQNLQNKRTMSKNLNTLSDKRENLQILRNTFFGG